MEGQVKEVFLKEEYVLVKKWVQDVLGSDKEK
jgi:hypothetical protein